MTEVVTWRAEWCRTDRQAAEERQLRRGGRVKLTADEVARLDLLLIARAEAERPMTVRQAFYRLVSFGVVEKDAPVNDADVMVGRVAVQRRKLGALVLAASADAH